MKLLTQNDRRHVIQTLDDDPLMVPWTTGPEGSWGYLAEEAITQADDAIERLGYQAHIWDLAAVSDIAWQFQAITEFERTR